MGKKIVNIAVAILVVALMAFVFVVPGFATERTYKIRMQVPLPAGYLDVYKKFASNLEKASNGHVKVKVFSAGQLVPFPEVIKAVSSKTIDMAAIVTGFHNELQTSDLFGGIPMGWTNIDEAILVLHRIHKGRINEILKEDLAAQGVEYIGYQWVGGLTLLSKRPIKTINDFKGLKVDASGKIIQEWLKKLGAEPYTLPIEETYTALATGMIDATISGLAGYYESVGHTETAKYFHTPYPVQALFVPIIINKNLWASLPDNLKEIVRTELIDLSIESQMNETYPDIVSRKKLNIVNWDNEMQEKMRKAAIESLDTVNQKGPLAAEFIEIYKESMEILK